MSKQLKHVGIFIIFFCFLVPSELTYGQDFLKKARKKDDASFNDLQKSFIEWAQERDLSQSKGWKYYKRWEDFNCKRASKDGVLPNPEIYYHEVEKLRQNKNRLKNSNGNYEWSPVGLFSEASVYDDEQLTGIGRINCMAFHPTDSNTFWVGVAQGGVWKTTNNGQSWIPLTDNLPMLRISDICVDKNNTDLMYISVGDYAYVGIGLNLNHRKRNTHYGLGVFKTSDGGQTWNPTGLTFEQTIFDGSLIRRVFIDNNNPEKLLAAGTQGIRKSDDGGNSWAQIKETFIWDIERHPTNPDILYATKGYVSTFDDGECGLIKSIDFGKTWTELPVGVYYTNDTLKQWLPFSEELPNVIISELEIHDATNKLYAGTFGRGIWNVDLYESNVYTNIENHIYNMEMNVFPNPSKGMFSLELKNFRCDNASLKVIDVSGKIVYSSVLSINKLGYTKTLNLSIPSGVYYVIVGNKNRRKTKKIVLM